MSTVTLASYLVGLVLLGVCGAAWLGTSWRIVGWLAPGLTGSTAGLARAVVTGVVAVVEAELLGTVGLFTMPALVVLAVAIAALVWRFVPVTTASADVDPRAPRARVDVWLALAGIGFALHRWMDLTIAVLRNGFGNPDTLMYHLPMTVDFVQRQSTLHYYVVGPEVVTTYHPMNNELLSAILVSAIGRDWLVHFLPLAWVGLALLSGWVIGRSTGRVGAAGLAVCAVALVIEAPILIQSSAGEALTDYAATSLFLAAAALLVALPRTTGSAALVGLAAGLGVGTKLSVLGVCVLVGLAVPLLAPRGQRGAQAAAALGGALLAGGYWFVRNIVHTGNPLPAMDIGVFPAPDLGWINEQNFAVAHYLGNGKVIDTYLLPQLADFWGFSWIPVLVLGLAGAVLAAWRDDGARRVLGVIALVGFVVYLVTPSGAFGFDGAPLIFGQNTRYAMPSLALGLVLLATANLVPTGAWARVRTGAVVALASIFAVVGVLEATAQTLLSPFNQHQPGWNALLVVTAVGVAGWLFVVDSRRSWTAVVVVVLVLGSVAALLARGPGSQRPTTTASLEPFALALDRAGVSRVAVFGSEQNYGLQNLQLTRSIEAVGVATPHGGNRMPATCRETIASLRAARAQAVFLEPHGRSMPADAATWLRSQAGLEPLARDARHTLYRLTEPLDPARCQVTRG